MLAILINQYVLPSPAGFAWLAPVLFLKIAAGHMVKD
jgi:hypothetical protein